MRGLLAQPRVRSGVVAGDVVGDLPSRVVDGFPFDAPSAALLELAEPGLDEDLRLRITITTATVGDTAIGQITTDIAGGELRPVIDAQDQRCRADTARGHDVV